MRRVVVRIDSLVLKGFRQEERHAIARGLSAELTRILSVPGAGERLRNGGAVAHVRAGSFNVSANARHEHIGAAAAGRIGKRLGL
jgi:hypothetical protein